MGTRVFHLAAVPLVATLAWTAWAFGQLGDGRGVTQSITWVEQLGLTIDLRFDGFSGLMLLLIAGIGTLVFVYARSYFHDGPKLGRTAAILLAFAGAMVGLVLADNLFALFLFWELTSVTSFLLIGTDDEKAGPRAAAVQALLITGGGGLAMLGGFVLLGQAAGTYTMSEILAAPPSGTVVDVALVLVLLGALTKSAQAPFHSWLPGAMAAPTPISAYLHSATMVKAGVYLVARFSPAFATVGWWRWTVVTAGLVTMLLGGYRSLRQHDLKLLLAYGTVSQLGLMMVLFGIGTPEATFAGCLVILAHGMYKASLFMTVGIIDHETGTRDLRRLEGLGRRWPLVLTSAAVVAASMAGIPPTLGFIAKEEALAAFDGATPGGWFVLAGVVVGSVLTVAYSARFVWGAFGPADIHHGLERRLVGADAPMPRPRFTLPAQLLAVLTLVCGIVPALVSGIVDDAFEALWFEAPDDYVALWHGFTLALALSVVVLAAGAALWGVRSRVEQLQDRVPSLPSAQRGYERTLKELITTADAVTAVTQSGSLPLYLSVILVTLVVLPSAALLGGAALPDLTFADSPLQVVIGIVMVVCAVAAAVARRRFAAVLLVGAIGYGMAALFVIQGAPDLAITQLLIETLGVVIFVLVIRHLPDEFRRPPIRSAQVLRIVLAVIVGAFVFAFTLLAVGAREDPSISGEYIDRSVPDGGGSNVVNVIIVDFRGFDTLGEITVLAVAALGVASIVRAGGRRGGAPVAGGDDDPSGDSNDGFGQDTTSEGAVT